MEEKLGPLNDESLEGVVYVAGCKKHLPMQFTLAEYTVATMNITVMAHKGSCCQHGLEMMVANTAKIIVVF